MVSYNPDYSWVVFHPQKETKGFSHAQMACNLPVLNLELGENRPPLFFREHLGHVDGKDGPP